MEGAQLFTMTDALQSAGNGRGGQSSARSTGLYSLLVADWNFPRDAAFCVAWVANFEITAAMTTILGETVNENH